MVLIGRLVAGRRRWALDLEERPVEFPDAPGEGSGFARADGPAVDLDRDRFKGRTPVQQLWDYLNNVPDCPWGIVSNFVSFRLYHLHRTQQAYELFTLQDLREADVFHRFYFLFERGGLLDNEAVNTINTLAGAFLAAAFTTLFI